MIRTGRRCHSGRRTRAACCRLMNDRARASVHARLEPRRVPVEWRGRVRHVCSGFTPGPDDRRQWARPARHTTPHPQVLTVGRLPLAHRNEPRARLARRRQTLTASSANRRIRRECATRQQRRGRNVRCQSAGARIRAPRRDRNVVLASPPATGNARQRTPGDDCLRGRWQGLTRPKYLRPSRTIPPRTLRAGERQRKYLRHTPAAGGDGMCAPRL